MFEGMTVRSQPSDNQAFRLKVRNGLVMNEIGAVHLRRVSPWKMLYRLSCTMDL
jgi:hypothetical protein